jgi:hypothetical protein
MEPKADIEMIRHNRFPDIDAIPGSDSFEWKETDPQTIKKLVNELKHLKSIGILSYKEETIPSQFKFNDSLTHLGIVYEDANGKRQITGFPNVRSISFPMHHITKKSKLGIRFVDQTVLSPTGSPTISLIELPVGGFLGFILE